MKMKNTLIQKDLPLVQLYWNSCPLGVHPRPVEEIYLVLMDLVSIEVYEAGLVDAIEK
jgi:hypothetical protein